MTSWSWDAYRVMTKLTELSVVFRTQSDVEASIVRGLLESEGFKPLLSSDIPHSVYPLSVGELGEVRVSVCTDDAARARKVIEESREYNTSGIGPLNDRLSELESRLGYSFRERDLLRHALTHRSRAHEDPSPEVLDNESLEFLGDAVLGLVIADYLFREFPDYDEGQKSKAKALLVSAVSLVKLGENIGLGAQLLLGRGEEKSGGRRKPSLIADAFEAIVAAIYLDGGLQPAEAFIKREFEAAFEEFKSSGAVAGLVSDYKSSLQEWLQAHDRPLPNYKLTGTHGPDHRKVFDVEVRVGQEVVARAEANTKKAAEQKAAEQALKRVLSSEEA